LHLLGIAPTGPYKSAQGNALGTEATPWDFVNDREILTNREP
jgi:hypothetical protein